jgi:hypothetical protein
VCSLAGDLANKTVMAEGRERPMYELQDTVKAFASNLHLPQRSVAIRALLYHFVGDRSCYSTTVVSNPAISVSSIHNHFGRESHHYPNNAGQWSDLSKAQQIPICTLEVS